MWLRCLVRKIPQRKKWKSIPVFLPGKFHGLRSLVDYCLWILKELYLLSEGACTRTYTHTHMALPMQAFQRVDTSSTVHGSALRETDHELLGFSCQARRLPSRDGSFFSSFNTAHQEPSRTVLGRLVIDLFISEGQFLVGGIPHSQSFLGTSWSWNFWILPWL